MDDTHHVEIEMRPDAPRNNRVVVGGNDLTKGLSGVSVSYSAGNKLPSVTLFPLVLTARVDGGPVKLAAHLSWEAEEALQAAGWTPPAKDA